MLDVMVLDSLDAILKLQRVGQASPFEHSEPHWGRENLFALNSLGTLITTPKHTDEPKYSVLG